ncbi:cytochrome C heme lyase [Vibrio genomosp. F6]|uniref:TPR domain-containing protein n=1 Tax=Vibrio genomosp. F6 TaxID=723172 RepID=UPI0010BD992E|nr:cytochrome C heme lyase [Vibrio genomosp. F6]
MQQWTFVFITVTCIFIVGFIYAMTPKGEQKKYSLALGVGVVGLSVIAWSVLRQPVQTVAVDTPVKHSSQKMMTLKEELQAQLTQDPNQGELWFQLGHGYVLENDFQSALTCFDYAIRLSESPTASQYAAKATALYYVSSQQMSSDVVALLDAAFELDPQNQTGLMLVANDHFISFRYQLAIDTWTKILDSERQEVDRVNLIQSINRAKELVNN